MPAKPLPWLTLLILLAAYTTFSWFLYHSTVTWLVWAMALAFALLQALLLTTFAEGFRRFLGSWLRSDVGYFTVIICGAFFIAVALVWIRVFGYITVLIAAEVLARLDLQSAGLNRLQTLSVLTVVSLAGLAIGWAVSLFIASY